MPRGCPALRNGKPSPEPCARAVRDAKDDPNATQSGRVPMHPANIPSAEALIDEVVRRLHARVANSRRRLRFSILRPNAVTKRGQIVTDVTDHPWLFINGGWVTPCTDKQIPVLSANTGLPIGSAPDAVD